MTKHEAVVKWLSKCPQAQQLYFQFGSSQTNNMIVSPSEETIAEFIDGSSERLYKVELIWFLPASTDADDINVDAMLDVDALNQWVETQNELRNYPCFPVDCTVQEIKLIDSGIGYVASEDGINAKYIIPFGITYTKEQF